MSCPQRDEASGQRLIRDVDHRIQRRVSGTRENTEAYRRIEARGAAPQSEEVNVERGVGRGGGGGEGGKQEEEADEPHEAPRHGETPRNGVIIPLLRVLYN